VEEVASEAAVGQAGPGKLALAKAIAEPSGAYEATPWKTSGEPGSRVVRPLPSGWTV
jgi:hypothetical protein